MRLLILLIISITFLLNSCKFPEFPDLIEVPIEPELAAYCIPGEVGTRYIYVDTLTGEHDTMTVEENHSIVTYQDLYKNQGREIQYTCSNTRDIRAQIFTNENGSDFIIYGMAGTSRRIIKDHTENSVFFPPERNTILDSISFLGNTYYDVLENDDRSIDYRLLVFSKEMGILIKEANTGFGQTHPRMFVLKEIIYP